MFDSLYLTSIGYANCTGGLDGLLPVISAGLISSTFSSASPSVLAVGSNTCSKLFTSTPDSSEALLNKVSLPASIDSLRTSFTACAYALFLSVLFIIARPSSLLVFTLNVLTLLPRLVNTVFLKLGGNVVRS